MSWRRFGSLVRHLPRDSHYARCRLGDDVQWGLTEQLLAAAVDALHDQVWQLGGDKNAPKPRKIPRPGVHDQGDKRYKARRSYRISEMRKILDTW